MLIRTKYAALDDIGFVGTDKPRSIEEIKRDARQMSAYLKRYKAVKKTSDRSTKATVRPAKVLAALSKKN